MAGAAQMSRKRKTFAPSDPMEIARCRAEERRREQDPSTWGLDRQALSLAAGEDVLTKADASGRLVRARRQDVFDLLQARGRLSTDSVEAVRRLQNDIACLHRTAMGGGDFIPRIDRSIVPEGFSDARQRAGVRIEAALSLAGDLSARVLAALCETEVVLGRAADWRGAIARQTGETLPDAQGAVLRMACENLACAYRRLDRAR
jgi:hypothetical protein